MPTESTTPNRLSFGQESLWLEACLHPTEPWYNIPSAVRIRDHLRIEDVHLAIQRVSDRHPTLTAAYRFTSGGLLRFDREFRRSSVSIEDLTGLDEPAIEQRIARAARLPFDLAVSGPFRADIFVLGARDWVVLFTVHHISSDFRSQSLLVQQFLDEYLGRRHLSHPDRRAFDHYVARERSTLSSGRRTELERFWISELERTRPAKFPEEHPRSETAEYHGDFLEQDIPSPLWANLSHLARTNNATLFATLSALYSVLIWKWSGDDDFMYAVPLSRRILPDENLIIGYLVNLVVVRSRIDPSKTFDSLLALHRKSLVSIYRNGEYPFPLLSSCVPELRAPSRKQALRLAFNLETCAPDLPAADLWAECDHGRVERYGEIEVRPQKTPHHVGTFDLAVKVIKSARSTRAVWSYNSSILSAETIAARSKQYLDIAVKVARYPHLPLREL